jgi:alkylation response protein AidB-like acyl-CoA dehydrogenase
MDLVYTPAQQRFRRELRAFLGAAVPEAWRANGGRGPRDPAERFAVVKRWMARLHEAGWAAPGWPAEHGGRGAGVVEQVIYQEELARAAAPPALNMLGVNLLWPTLIAHGTSEQTREHLPRILSGERLWCQGFSEPDAGSDLASLRTRAELHGDRFVVNGQKIWTSLASVADGIFTLVRTDPAARRHRGISYLLVDLRSPGITVRPIRQITGSSEFCEVFFDDVEVPATNLVGELHRGWEVAHTTLGHERGTAFLGSQVRYERIVRELIGLSGRTSYNGAPRLRRRHHPPGAGPGLVRAAHHAPQRVPQPDPGGQGGPGGARGVGQPAAHLAVRAAAARAGRPPPGRPGDRGEGLARRGPRGPVAARLPEHQGQHHRRGHRRDPAQHRQREGARPAPRPRHLGRGAGRSLSSQEGAEVDFGFNEEQDMLRTAVRGFLDSRSPVARVRELVDSAEGFDPELWRAAGGLGWFALLAPEAHGGAARSIVDVVVVAEELGRLVQPGPFLPANVVVLALAESGTEEQRAAHLPGLASGETTAAWAVFEPGGTWGPGGVGLRAEPSGDGVRLDGVKTYVQDAAVADLILVTARHPDGLVQCLVDSTGEGVRVEPLSTFDLTRRFAKVHLDGVAVPVERIVGQPGGAEAQVARQLQAAAILTCADSIGGAQQVLDMTVEYARHRVQFDRPIGSFQAIKHKCADMLLRLEASRAATYYAALAFQDGMDDLDEAVSIAKSYVGDAYADITGEGLQIHGGIGFTWEHDIHLYLRRAKTSEVLWGDPAWHRERLCRLLEV